MLDDSRPHALEVLNEGHAQAILHMQEFFHRDQA